jgi:hypothetical protein
MTDIADGATAIATGYRPGANRLPEEYRVWTARR